MKYISIEEVVNGFIVTIQENDNNPNEPLIPWRCIVPKDKIVFFVGTFLSPHGTIEKAVNTLEMHT